PRTPERSRRAHPHHDRCPEDGPGQLVPPPASQADGPGRPPTSHFKHLTSDFTLPTSFILRTSHFLLPQHLSRHRLSQRLRAARKELERAYVLRELLDDVAAAERVAAEHLGGAEERALRRIGRRQLGHRGF